jgi:hypothetical protein
MLAAIAPVPDETTEITTVVLPFAVVNVALPDTDGVPPALASKVTVARPGVADGAGVEGAAVPGAAVADGVAGGVLGFEVAPGVELQAAATAASRTNPGMSFLVNVLSPPEGGW